MECRDSGVGNLVLVREKLYRCDNMRMGENLLLKLLIHSKWLQQHEKLRNCCKQSSMFILKIVTGNKGIKKNIGGMKGTFRFDYEFAFSNFRD